MTPFFLCTWPLLDLMPETPDSAFSFFLQHGTCIFCSIFTGHPTPTALHIITYTPPHYLMGTWKGKKRLEGKTIVSNRGKDEWCKSIEKNVKKCFASPLNSTCVFDQITLGILQVRGGICWGQKLEVIHRSDASSLWAGLPSLVFTYSNPSPQCFQNDVHTQ